MTHSLNKQFIRSRTLSIAASMHGRQKALSHLPRGSCMTMEVSPAAPLSLASQLVLLAFDCLIHV